MAGRWAKKKHVRMSLRSKLFITLLFVSILPVVLVTFISMYTLNTTLYNQIIENGRSSSGTLQDRLDLVIEDYSNVFYDFEVDTTFKEDILSWCETGALDYSRQWELISALNETISTDNRINSIELYNLCNGQVLVAKRSGAKLLTDGSGYGVWGSRDAGLQTNTVFIRRDNEILVMHQMNSFATGNALVVVMVHVRYRAVEGLLEETLSSDLNSLLVYNDSGDLVLSIIGQASDDIVDKVTGQLAAIESLETGQTPLKVDGQYLFPKSVGNGKLYIIQGVPEDIITAATNSTLRTGVLIGGLCIIVAMALSAVLSRIISHPIVDLAETMKTLSVNDFSVEADIRREDEIGLLQKSFHSMVARNQELINREYISKLGKNHAQICALQAQINPHFLYNTLQTIGGMALNDQISNVYAMTVALSEIMRYSLDFSEEMVPISKELKYLESYLFIQNQRFLGRLNVSIDIPEELQDCLIPKLILQPVIENSLEHGMKNKAGPWQLDITAKRTGQDDILIRIKDNGTGIAPDKLRQIQSRLADTDKVWESTDHIGLQNVNTRIRLTYQDPYHVSISSQKDEGTTVEIWIRAITEVSA